MSARAGDHSEYVAFVRRGGWALARRVGEADPEDLAEMLTVAGEQCTDSRCLTPCMECAEAALTGAGGE